MNIIDAPENYEGNDLESMSSATNYYNWMTDEFSSYMKGTVIEVGAGAGTFTSYLLKANPKRLYAIEPSLQMGKVLKEKFSDKKQVLVLNSLLKKQQTKLSNKADTIFYINVLEHVKNDAEELKIAFDVLKPGGYLCIYVPAVNALLGSFDEHVGHFRRYGKRELKNKLEAAGFEVDRINYSDIVGIVPWFINFKILKSKRLSPKSVTLYDKAVIPIIRKQEDLFKPFIGKNIWAIARKPD